MCIVWELKLAVDVQLEARQGAIMMVNFFKCPARDENEVPPLACTAVRDP